MKLVLIGPPGCGKGTQAELLSKKFGIPHVSSGNILRAEVAAGTAFGKKIKQYMEKGEIGPQKLITKLILSYINKNCSDGFILDGFPRTVYQAQELDKHHNIVAAIYFKLPKKEIIARITGRRTCKSCARVYHIRHAPPKKKNICDTCGGELYQRDDDKKETIVNRINVYEMETIPVIEYYKLQGILKFINAAQSPEMVFEEILHLV
ncbi:MAG: nucleoside monophosphate kinase [Spirochaetes bacterium]|nr:nucleoside monophosphate kinase [Spirochaetota bacterium]